MFVTVVIHGIASTLHRHRNIDLVDLQATVLHRKRHRTEVRIVIGKLSESEAHVRDTGIRTGSRAVAAEINISSGV